VAPDDFLAFAFIMAYGNRKAAAEQLEIPHRTFYDRVGRWATMDQEHQRMYRLVEWRKNVGRKISVNLPETVMSGDSGERAENPETIKQALDALRANAAEGDHSQLLGDILQALQSQSATNWMSVRQELIEVLREEIPQ
jgi:hypothetical protein